MSNRIGLDAKLYRNTGTWAVPTWVEITSAREVTLNLEKAMAEVMSRASQWKRVLPALKDASVEFELLYDGADDSFTAVKDAWLAGTHIDLAIMDGDITVAGTQGFRAEMHIASFSRAEPLEEPLTASVTVRPAADTTNDPEWMVIP